MNRQKYQWEFLLLRVCSFFWCVYLCLQPTQLPIPAGWRTLYVCTDNDLITRPVLQVSYRMWWLYCMQTKTFNRRSLRLSQKDPFFLLMLVLLSSVGRISCPHWTIGLILIHLHLVQAHLVPMVVRSHLQSLPQQAPSYSLKFLLKAPPLYIMQSLK